MNTNVALNTDEIGNYVWSVLHSLGAHYPNNPNMDKQYHAIMLVKSIGKLLPCSFCSQHFLEYIDKNPPQVNSRTSFCKWICKAHNSVNKELGKEIFPNDIDKLDERWLYYYEKTS